MLQNTMYNNEIVPSTTGWDKDIFQKTLDMLSVFARETSKQQLTSHRWRGKDTLTLGNPSEWIVIKWMAQNISESGNPQLILKRINCWKPLTEIALNQLRQFYDFRNPTEIIRFLTTYQQLIPVLREAHAVIKEIFGNDAQIALEVVKDPEATNTEKLFAYINADAFSPEEALTRLYTFDEVWFLKQVDGIGGYLNFNLE
ncbi:MAG: hypothetical protein ANABAC_1277 [Anaerolineae bacterium]|nr:MAG: hypothetical protein ANABAC_1277 [Anaerolineae bacterium]